MILSQNDLVRDYKVVRKVGEGGMGSVYLAEDTMLDRKVAVKILNPLLTQDEQFTSRFRQEAKVQASLLHPNIVAMYNFFQEGDNYCMVMEYAEGETLKELIRRTGPIPEERALKIFRQMLEGVGYAHSKGIIHRDIKPSNIIVDSRDNVKVMDFGIAKIMGDRGMTKTGMKMGTVLYMSPEQVRAEKDIDQRTDIYSLGITLYEMLTGRVPYNTDTDSDFELMNEIVNREIKDPREFYPNINDSTLSLLNRIIEKNKQDRPQSINDILGNSININTSNFYNNVSTNSTQYFQINSTTDYFNKKIVNVTKLKESTFSRIINLDVSRDSKQIALACYDKAVSLIDIETLGIMRLAGHKDKVNDIKYLKSGRSLISCSQDGTIIKWNLSNKGIEKIFLGHRGAINSIDISSDDKFIISGGYDRTVRVWSIESGTLYKQFNPVPGTIQTLNFIDDRRTFICGESNGNINIFNIDSGILINTINISNKIITSSSVFKSNQLIIVASGDKRIYQISDPNLNNFTIIGEHEDSVLSVDVFGSDYVVSGGADNKVNLWSLSKSKRIFNFSGHSNQVWGVKFSPDGRYIISADFGGLLKAYQIEWN